MPKLSYQSVTLTTVFIFLIAQTAFGLPLNYPVVQNSDSNTPFCYMKTQDGRTLDLSNICGFASPAVCSDANAKPELATLLKDFCKKNQRCQITSTCNEMPQALQRPTTGDPL
jgi:hypothetical protein